MADAVPFMTPDLDADTAIGCGPVPLTPEQAKVADMGSSPGVPPLGLMLQSQSEPRSAGGSCKAVPNTKNPSPYGRYCPTCGEPTVETFGDIGPDVCDNGHRYNPKGAIAGPKPGDGFLPEAHVVSGGFGASPPAPIETGPITPLLHMADIVERQIQQAHLSLLHLKQMIRDFPRKG